MSSEQSALSRAPLDEAIAFIDLKAQQARIRDRIEARLKAVLDHGRYINGPEIAELEERLQDHSGAACAVAVASGTDAIVIPLMAENIGPGDAVFAPAFTYNATVNAILMTGATPVLVDVCEKDFNIDPKDLERRIAEVAQAGDLRPRAIIAVDLFGLPADYPALQKIADDHDMLLIADAAQSYGGEQGDRRVGAIAQVTTTSFFPAKALGCYGDGGAIFSRDEKYREIWESIRWHGTDGGRRDSIRVGMNGRLDTMQAAVLLEKLDIFDEELAARRAIAARYEERLAGLCDLAQPPAGAVSGYGLFSVTVDHRNRVAEHLQSFGVPTAIYYKQPLHRMDAFAAFAPEGGLPACDRLSARILSLPMHPYLSDRQVERVCDAFAEAVEAVGH